MQHPIVASPLWSSALIIVFAPPASRLYRRRLSVHLPGTRRGRDVDCVFGLIREMGERVVEGVEGALRCYPERDRLPDRRLVDLDTDAVVSGGPVERDLEVAAHAFGELAAGQID